MSTWFVFNGDADGLCAQQQMRLYGGVEPEGLVTGVKRDISLLKRLPGEADRALVFDIAVEKNASALDEALARGVRVEWFDHHNPGPLPAHPGFTAHIDTARQVNTSLIVHRHLNLPTAAWAVMGLFGDNMDATATDLAQAHGLAPDDVDRLRQGGRLLNYNAYGETVDDLHYPPAELARFMAPHADPLDFLAQSGVADRLAAGREQDLASAQSAPRPAPGVVVLPAQPWARRAVGELANQLARQEPEKAHAVLVEKPGGYVVSVRAPLGGGPSAAALCARFPTGGGRDLAAGINLLAVGDLDAFLAAFAGHYV